MKETKGKETQAVSGYESMAGGSKSEQKPRQSVLKNDAFIRGCTTPESLKFDYPNEKI